MEGSAPQCLDRLLELDCDAILICQGLMAAMSLAYLRKKAILPGRDLAVVSFVDYNIQSYELYYDNVDCIVQPVEELGRIAGEQILARVERPDSPVLERVLTSFYRPCGGDAV